MEVKCLRERVFDWSKAKSLNWVGVSGSESES